MCSLTDKDKATLIDELKGEIFLNVKEGYHQFSQDNFVYVSKDEYLSGNIREKMATLVRYMNMVTYEKKNLEKVKDSNVDDYYKKKEYLENQTKLLEYQQEELYKVLPKNLEASEINVRLGATWIPTEDIQKFITDTLEPSYWTKRNIHVSFSPFTSEWKIDGKKYFNNNSSNEMTYGTSRINACELIEKALNLKEPKIFDQIEDGKGKKQSVLNKKETLLAIQKQELLKEEFKKWIFKDSARRSRLVKTYNDLFNSVRNREYDGSHLTFDGMSADIELKPHQRNAVARCLYGGNSLLAHVVGAGKTFEMATSAMESKRLGLCSKSLLVVPNHIVGQIGREFMQLYPSANILVASKKDFEPQNRKRFIGKIATGEYDAVVIGHKLKSMKSSNI